MSTPSNDSPSSQPSQPRVLREDRQQVAWLTLNRAEEYNLISRAMLDELKFHLEALETDSAVRVVVIASTGKAFSAGHDLKELADRPAGEVNDLFAYCTRIMESIRLHPKPVIAQVNGVAAAAGCQLVASCDLAVASDTSRFGTTGIRNGLFCSTPMVPLSRVVPTKKALEMLLTGRLINAEEALEAGLVNQVVPQPQLEEATQELAAQIAANSPYAVRLGKQAFYRQLPMNHEGGYEIGEKAMVDNILAEDGQEGIHAFLEKRPPNYKG